VERTKHSDVEPLLLWDERLTGFGVAVYASGTKRYIIQFRVKGSRPIAPHGHWFGRPTRS
jgi:hypothetical protein